MANGLPCRRQLFHHPGRESLCHQSHILVADDGVFANHGNAGSLLTPVLHGQQPVVADAGSFLPVCLRL